MAYSIRRSAERKYFDHDWLKTYHTFSFGSYYDARWMGFRDLRVINEDRVAPGAGFPPHNHRDMEIISIVLAGELAHRDSIGTESLIEANQIQAMSAGRGVTHSEYNPSEDNLVHFLQIWIVPDTQGIEPRYQQVALTSSESWHLIASPEGPLKIQQDVKLYLVTLSQGEKIEKTLHRYGWLQVIEGDLQLNQDTLHTGDGVALEPTTVITLQAQIPSRVLFFDLK